MNLEWRVRVKTEFGRETASGRKQPVKTLDSKYSERLLWVKADVPPVSLICRSRRCYSPIP